jgi:hypothetical protein
MLLIDFSNDRNPGSRFDPHHKEAAQHNLPGRNATMVFTGNWVLTTGY